MDITFLKAVRIYCITVPIFFIIDMVWLGVAARDFYRQRLGHLLRPDVNWTAAVLFYLVFIVGIVFFAVKPGLEAQSQARALFYGALFGFFTYATYDLTNLATVRDWPLSVTVVDLIWGTVLCAAVAWVSYLINHRIA
ncbi:MAG: DUF2177 family protein [Acidobacteria bacterium]|nr:DUF2177 family protein [Acidobacteriota bacterium]